MNALRKKFLSAFIEISDSQKAEPLSPPPAQSPGPVVPNGQLSPADTKFTEHFSELFAEAGFSGPGYLEFSRMMDVMQAVMKDEKALYSTAFAGLQVQGLDKQKLLASVQQFANLLDEDAVRFEGCMRTTYQEKVVAKKEEMEAAVQAIQSLSEQIATMQQQIATWAEEVTVNETKISNSNYCYHQSLQSNRDRLQNDANEINLYL